MRILSLELQLNLKRSAVKMSRKALLFPRLPSKLMKLSLRKTKLKLKVRKSIHHLNRLKRSAIAQTNIRLTVQSRMKFINRD